LLGLSERDLKKDATTLAGTTILGTLVVIFDYSMKFSGLKIPFPWLPYLKFDFTGVPIVLSLLLFGLTSGTTTSTVAFLAILARSGDLVGAAMKALAEFSTILGMTFAIKLSKENTKITKISSLILGVSSRSIIMFFANLIIFPQMAVILTSPLTVVFNVIQGSISIISGYFLYGIIVRKTSFLTLKNERFESAKDVK
jgi:riboflavin transporter FmnP